MKHSILLFVCLLFARSYAQDALQISFQQTAKISSSFKGGELVGDMQEGETTSSIAYLLYSDGSFELLEEDGARVLYDLKEKMIYGYREDTLFRMVPLHSIINYRVAEFNNRQGLGNMLAKGGVENMMGDQVALESTFGIEATDSKIGEQITQKRKKNNYTFFYEDKELLKISFSKENIPAAFQDAYEHLLTYEFEVHPAILRQIAEEKKIPASMSFTFVDVMRKIEKEMTFKEVKLIKDERKELSFDNMIPQKDTNTSLVSLINSLVFQFTFYPTPEADSVLLFQQSDQYLEEEHNLSALLVLFEYLLSSGIQPLERVKNVVPLAEKDTILNNFMYAMSQSRSEEEAQDKVEVLEELIQLNIPHGFMLNIFAANGITPISPDKGMDYFYEALKVNPYITGAWKDLGSIYNGSYNFEEGWKCYQIMLALERKHPMAEQIKELKANLERDFPQYFAN
ncbi:MAG: hypothetical protein AAFY71_26430 [Bacteroidota bacterium]